MNVATVTTIEAVLTETRPADATDYRTWGQEAAKSVARDAALSLEILTEAMTARARGRIAREQSRTSTGVARLVADSVTGQMKFWAESTDPVWLRATGKRYVEEGRKKIELGRLMQQAADCVEAHPGFTARDAWLAEGLDVAELDAATEIEAEA